MLDYFAYQRQLTDRFLVPLLREAGLDLASKRVLDVGCGHGGVLCRLSEVYGLQNGLGVDLDPHSIEFGMSRAPAGVAFRREDFFDIRDSPFDLVIMRDVLEHIRHPDVAFEKACSMVSPGGCLFISYGPFYGPFGGHQHNSSGIFSWLPWVHLLPSALFWRLLRFEGNAYKQRGALEADIEAVLDTRLTVFTVRTMVARCGFGVVLHRKYLVRPDHEVKYKLASLRLPDRYLGLVTELACTGEEILLRRQPRV